MAPVSAARRRWRLFASACAVLASLAGAVQAQEQADHREVKAAFLLQFGSYVQWPDAAFARPDSPIVIAVAGADPVFERLLQAVAGRTIGSRPVAARRLQRGDALAGLHMVFIGNGTGAWGAELLDRARRRPVLVVTEVEPGLPSGSVINFTPVENRVRFDVSLEAAEANSLRLSALLLSVARQVRGRPS
jgi:hypothetical protein